MTDDTTRETESKPMIPNGLPADPEVRAMVEIEKILETLKDLPKGNAYRTPQQRVIAYMAEKYGLSGKAGRKPALSGRM